MDYQIVPKTQNQHFMFVISFLIFSSLPYCLCIVNRDLVLTPKQGLQLSGKRIFYEESINKEANSLNHNGSASDMGIRPWEHTLKHVTYLTLFTNAATGIITGNFSKVKEYSEFLNSAYTRSENPIDSRFGDIVTLAQGRLETMSNGSYRFTEGDCDYECARDSNIVAMWHVQKIRHRDTADRKYHYEMKFSVSPMTAKAPTETVVRGGPNKRTIMEERRNNMQTFIQKEDDYPHSFRKIVPDKDESFSEKHYDAARNFRQVNPHYKTQQVTPIPQSTFLRGIYHHPPLLQHASMQLQRPNVALQHSIHTHSRQQHNHHHQQQLPLPERLNMGEFYKGNYIPKTTSKIELFPNLLNMFMGKTHSLPPPTTFPPPTYQMKFPRPEIYALHQPQTQEFPKFSEYQQPPLSQAQDQFKQKTPAPVPIVTHHYHHHFFMPNNSAITIEQAILQSDEQSQNPPVELYHNEVTEVAAPHGYITNFNEEPHATTALRQHHFPQIMHQVQTQYHPKIQQQTFNPNYHSNYHVQQVLPPAPQKFIFPNTQIEQQHVLHVTSAPPLRKPQYIQQQEHYENRPFTSSLEYTTVHVPLLISYPAPIHEENRADIPTPRNKPFEHSDPIEDSIQYSEPDPLYVNVNEAYGENRNKFLSNAEHQQQDESQEPQLESPDHFDQQQNSRQQNIEEADSKKEHSESVEAQLPAPSYNTNFTEEDKSFEDTKRNIPEQSTTQSASSNQISNGKNITESSKTEVSNSITAATKIPKIFASRNKRINLRAGTPSSTSTTNNPPASTSSSQKSLTTETLKLSTTSKPRKAIVSTSSPESASRTISRYRNSYVRTSSANTTTATTEKPVLKWTPKRKNIIAKFMAIRSTTPVNDDKKDEIDENDDKEDNEENEDFKANESNNLRRTKPSMLPTNTGDFTSETTTEMSKAIATSVSTTMSTLSSSPQSVASLLSQTTQSGTEIYEILTQKSVSKSVSLKVGNNGEEIPVIIDDGENEVKTV